MMRRLTLARVLLVAGLLIGDMVVAKPTRRNIRLFVVADEKAKPPLSLGLQ